jgi:hypothetical protein
VFPGESEKIRKLKDIVRKRLDYRFKMSEAVLIAAMIDPAVKHLVSCEKTEDELKAMLCQHKQCAFDFLSQCLKPNESQDGEASNAVAATNLYC